LAVNPLKVVVVPEPVVVVPPGDAVTVQEPVAGKPLRATDPVETAQVGCVIVPTIGADAAVGAVFIAADVDAVEIQPPAFVTVNV
jgi:hypothetical protein